MSLYNNNYNDFKYIYYIILMILHQCAYTCIVCIPYTVYYTHILNNYLSY